MADDDEKKPRKRRKKKKKLETSMKKFTVPCNFGGQKSPFTIYIGEPKDGNHPIQNQADWLSKERGGSVPPEVMDSLSKLKELADKNNVSFEELCVYALGAAVDEGDGAKKEEASTETKQVENKTENTGGDDKPPQQ